MRVENLRLVPKRFFTPDIVEKRASLAPTSRRAGWVSRMIRLGKIPAQGRISLISNGVWKDKSPASVQVRRATFLSTAGIRLADGWAGLHKRHSQATLFAKQTFLKAGLPGGIRTTNTFAPKDAASFRCCAIGAFASSAVLESTKRISAATQIVHQAGRGRRILKAHLPKAMAYVCFRQIPFLNGRAFRERRSVVAFSALSDFQVFVWLFRLPRRRILFVNAHSHVYGPPVPKPAGRAHYR